MKIILNDSDIESMSDELRDNLERFITSSRSLNSTGSEKTAQWFCLNCYEVRSTYCGTNIKIGNHSLTKGKPCALQILPPHEQREMNKAAAEGGWDTRTKTLGCEFKPIAD